MPIKSEAQRRYLWANHPDIAKRWEAETPDDVKLPEKVKKKHKKYQIGGGQADDLNKPQINNLPDTTSNFYKFVSDPANKDLLEAYKRAGYSYGADNGGNNIKFERPTGAYDLSPEFKTANAVLDSAAGIANFIGNITTNKREHQQYLESIQPRIGENKDAEGLNSNPIYYKAGGWIQHAIKHPGRCAHPGDEKCPEGSPQYNLAMRFKHGDLHKQNGGENMKEWKFKTGGDITAEAGEIIESTNGNINKIPDSAATHDSASGGVIVHGAHRILEDTGDKRNDPKSKILRLDPKEAFALTGVKTNKPVTHAKAFELAAKLSDKEAKHTEGFLKKNVDAVEDSPNDPYAHNSLQLNFKRLGVIPTKGELFDKLFEHQEFIKDTYNIGDDGNKAQVGFGNAGLAQYLKNQAMFNPNTIPTVSLSGINLDENGRPLYGEDYFNSAGYNTVYPSGVTDYGKGMTVPNVQHRTDAGVYGQNWDMADFYARHPFVKQQRPNFDPKNPQDVGWFQNEYNKRSQEYFGIPYFNGQGHRKLDSLFGQGTWSTPDVTPNAQLKLANPDASSISEKAPLDLGYGKKGKIGNMIPQPDSPFRADLKWYDTAAATTAFLGALQRRQVPYNGADLTAPKAKYLNPLPALQAGQADFNAAQASLPDNGVGYANQANLFSKKYNLDNEVIGKYDNANNGIWTQNEGQVVDIKNKQALLDQNSRDVHQGRIAQGLEAQRQQLLRSMNDITTTIAQNAKYNREGQLLMKLFPNFTQQGNFNGNQRYIMNPTGAMADATTKIKMLEAQGIKLTPSQKYAILTGIKK